MTIDWSKTLTYWAAGATVVQAAVAMVMMRGLGHARAQAQAANATLKVIEENSERQLRAYMNIKEAEIGLREAGKPIEIKINLVNSGQTPAKGARLTYRWGIVPSNLVDVFEIEPQGADEEESVATVSAGGPLGALLTIPAASWEPHANALDNGEARLVVVGRASYVDIFEKKRITKFRLQIVQAFHPTLLVACKTGNEST